VIVIFIVKNVDSAVWTGRQMRLSHSNHLLSSQLHGSVIVTIILFCLPFMNTKTLTFDVGRQS